MQTVNNKNVYKRFEFGFNSNPDTQIWMQNHLKSF